jgi:hypothetical protein
MLRRAVIPNKVRDLTFAGRNRQTILGYENFEGMSFASLRMTRVVWI